MGEDAKKNVPKVEGQEANQKRYAKWQSRQQRNKNRALKDFKALTTGLEKELFTVGTASNAAEFEEV